MPKHHNKIDSGEIVFPPELRADSPAVLPFELRIEVFKHFQACQEARAREYIERHHRQRWANYCWGHLAWRLLNRDEANSLPGQEVDQ